MEMCVERDYGGDDHERTQIAAIARETLLQFMSLPAEVEDNIQGNPEEERQVEQRQVEPECTVCMDEIVDTALVPCGHLALCSVSIYPLLFELRM